MALAFFWGVLRDPKPQDRPDTDAHERHQVKTVERVGEGEEPCRNAFASAFGTVRQFVDLFNTDVLPPLLDRLSSGSKT